MLKPHEVEQVKQLATQGYTQRQIHLATGHSRDTIRRIVRGQRPDYEALRAQRQQQRQEEVLSIFSGPIGRCPECGARVYLPCVACQVRRHAAVRRAA